MGACALAAPQQRWQSRAAAAAMHVATQMHACHALAAARPPWRLPLPQRCQRAQRLTCDRSGVRARCSPREVVLIPAVGHRQHGTAHGDGGKAARLVRRAMWQGGAHWHQAHCGAVSARLAGGDAQLGLGGHGRAVHTVLVDIEQVRVVARQDCRGGAGAQMQAGAGWGDSRPAGGMLALHTPTPKLPSQHTHSSRRCRLQPCTCRRGWRRRGPRNRTF